jgi:hypothetical protein
MSLVLSEECFPIKMYSGDDHKPTALTSLSIKDPELMSEVTSHQIQGPS